LGLLRTVVQEVNESACNVAAEELGNERWDIRMEAAEALALFGQTATQHAAILARLLKDTRAPVRDAAATALTCMGAEGRGWLAVALQDVDWKSRTAAAKALESLGVTADARRTIAGARDA